MEYIAHDILPGCRYCLKEQTISVERASAQKILTWYSVDHVVEKKW